MPAVGQVHAQHRITGLKQRKIHRHVGLRAGVGLHVGMLCTKQLFGPLNGQILHLVNVLAAAVIALAGIALGVFIGQDRPHGRHDRRRNKIFGGDQLDIPPLAA